MRRTCVVTRVLLILPLPLPLPDDEEEEEETTTSLPLPHALVRACNGQRAAVWAGQLCLPARSKGAVSQTGSDQWRPAHGDLTSDVNRVLFNPV